MSDFLIPAINERLKEKRMDRNFKSSLTSAVVEGFGKWKRAMDAADTDAGVKSINETEDALVRLFLDTIEKAKPKPSKVSSEYSTSIVDRIAYDVAFDGGVESYRLSLKKEIGK